MNNIWILASLGVMAGSLSASGMPFIIDSLAWLLALGGLLVGFCTPIPLKWKRVFIILFSFLYGFCVIQTAQINFEHVSWRAPGKIIVMQGEVTDYPREKSFGQSWKMKIHQFRMEEGVWIAIPPAWIEVQALQKNRVPLIGDRLIIKGKIFFPQTQDERGRFIRKMLFLRGVVAQIRVRNSGDMIFLGVNYFQTPWRAVQLIREAFQQKIEKDYSGRTKEILKALLLGIRLTDRNLKDIFVRTGTSHLLSVSGFHAGIAAGIIFWITLICRLSPRKCVFFSVLGVLAYTALTGWGIAVQRAGLMAASVWSGWAMGRPRDLKHWLHMALAILLIVDPKKVWDISFQLSFLAMYGIVYAAPVFKRVLPVPGLDITLAAFLATYPAILFHFQTWAWSGILVNLIAVPIFALILPLGYISLFPVVGILGIYTVKVLLSGVLIFLDYAASLSTSCLTFKQPDLLSVYTYYFLGGLCLGVFKLRRHTSTFF